MPRTAARGGPATRARIAQAAAALFVDRGFDAVTVAEVARAAGVSSATVFKHFPRKEDLYLDRADEAAELLRAAVRERPAGADVLSCLHAAAVDLLDARHPLSGLDERSVPFFRTVAASPALTARVREIAADLQQLLTTELERDPACARDAALLAALVIAGYATVFGQTARQRTDQETLGSSVLVEDHRRRLQRLFDVLRAGAVALP